jgi:uncharacterized protein
MTEQSASSHPLYNEYGLHLQEIFGEKIQKISINTGNSCPNRDGKKGKGGCSYCNASSFVPDYCKPTKDILSQIDLGIKFFERKKKRGKYIAYFQSYTNTYDDINILHANYLTALKHPEVCGILIGTRPDCINSTLLEMLSSLKKHGFVGVEYGIETTLNRSLNRINRCHTFEDSLHAIHLTKQYDLHMGVHLILGLPGESRQEMIQHAITLSKLPINTLKLHHLQIVKHTTFANDFSEKPSEFNLFSREEYIQFLGDFIGHLRPDISIERFISQVPLNLLIAPKWDFDKTPFNIRLKEYLKVNQLYQGKCTVSD